MRCLKKLSLRYIVIFFVLLAGVASAAERAAPEKIYGIYLNSYVMRTPKVFSEIIANAKKHRINTLVCDYEGQQSGNYLQNFNLAKEEKFYLVARIVVFQDGATTTNIRDEKNWLKKQGYAKQAEKLGFNEIQFDYIRFVDAGRPDKNKRVIIGDFLKEAVVHLNIPVQIDVFGSVAYHPHDVIGQDLNYFADIIDAVCPMLYPSHFFLDKMRMSKPYFTMHEGITLAKKQISYRPVKVIPYIQSFALNVSYSGLTVPEYVAEQIKAVKDAKADGFFVWNANSDYRDTWAALKKQRL